MGLLKKAFMGFLTSTVNASNNIKCVSLNNEQCMTQRTLINFHPNQYSQGLCYYPFAINLDRCARSCNTLNDTSSEISVPYKTEDLNLNFFNMITGKNV